MNANEVIATLATRTLGRKVHPNDHVNMSQSSNDVIPTAIHVSAYRGGDRASDPGAETSAATPSIDKAGQLDHVVKTGRTHLMDAMPVRMSQELGGWSSQIGDGMCADSSRPAAPARAGARRHRRRHRHQRASGVRRRMAAKLGAMTGLPFVTQPQLFRESQQPGRGGRAERPAEDRSPSR